VPRNGYQKAVSITADFAGDGASQYIPIIDSHEYTRFTVSIEFAGAGDVTLLGSLSGDATQKGSDIPAADGDGYVMIKNAMDNGILDAASGGIRTFSLETFVRGGIILHLQNLDADATIVVQMMGNVFGSQVSRGV